MVSVVLYVPFGLSYMANYVPDVTVIYIWFDCFGLVGFVGLVWFGLVGLWAVWFGGLVMSLTTIYLCPLFETFEQSD